MHRVALLIAAFAQVALTATGATLLGRVVVVGEVAEPRAIDPGRDSCCVAAAPKDDSVLVGPEGGLANVVVYLRPRRGEAPPTTAPAPTEPLVVANKRCAFTPRVSLLRIGQPLVLTNEDPTTHNVSATTRRNGSFNLVLPPDDRRELRLEAAERAPITLACNVHPFMRGYILAIDHPYTAVTGRDGRFEIADLPPGDWRFQFWHETGELAGVRYDGGVTDRRGRAAFGLSPGAVRDLGDLRVPAERLR